MGWRFWIGIGIPYDFFGADWEGMGLFKGVEGTNAAVDRHGGALGMIIGSLTDSCNCAYVSRAHYSPIRHACYASRIYVSLKLLIMLKVCIRP